MGSKLEMMFTDNRMSTQCRLTRLAQLTPVEIIGLRLSKERQLSSQPEVKTAGPDWLSDVEISDPSVSALFQFSQAIGPQAEEWNHYHALLERYYEKYESYLNEKNAFEDLLGRTAPLELKILNAGESIERDLLVEMKLPEDITLYAEKDYPQKPTEPIPPERPAPVYEKMLNGSLEVQRTLFAAQTFKEDSIIMDLKIQKCDGYNVSFRVKKLPQQGRLVVGKFYVVFPTLEAAKSFSIDYEVFAEGRRSVKQGVLNIKVVGDRK